MMTTTIDVEITSNNVDTSTAEMELTTDKSTAAEMELTTDKSTAAEMTTININTEAPTVFDTTISTTKTSTRTSTTSTITQTTPYIETPTTPIEITETEAKTSSETFTSTPTLTPRTTVSTTTLTTTNTPDVERPETTTTTIGDRPKGSSPAGIIVGTLAGVFAVVLIISLYLNRQKLYARFSSKSELNEQIIPKYVNSQSADGYVQLDHIAEQSSFA
jgi:cobalamin biosynthesis Mg chelatase CobN